MRYISISVHICTCLTPYLSGLDFCKIPVWNIEFNELDFLSSLNLIFTACHSAVSPLENTNGINFILQLSEVINLIWWLKLVKSVLITFRGQVKVKNSLERVKFFIQFGKWQEKTLKINVFKRFCEKPN